MDAHDFGGITDLVLDEGDQTIRVAGCGRVKIGRAWWSGCTGERPRHRGLRWIVLPTVAVVGLVAGGLLARALGGCGLTAPLGVVHQAPAMVVGEQVWRGRMQDGVPVGWTHSQGGAIAAATNYIAILNSELLFDDAKRNLAVDAIATPEAHVRLQRALDTTAKSVAAALTRDIGGTGTSVTLDPAKVIFQAIPVRYRVDHYDGTHASITIWMTGVAGYQDSSLPVQEAWGLTSVRLQWTDGDWKETGATVQDGPVPVADDTPPTPTPALVREAQQFKEYRYAPGQ